MKSYRGGRGLIFAVPVALATALPVYSQMKLPPEGVYATPDGKILCDFVRSDIGSKPVTGGGCADRRGDETFRVSVKGNGSTYEITDFGYGEGVSKYFIVLSPKVYSELRDRKGFVPADDPKLKEVRKKFEDLAKIAAVPENSMEALDARMKERMKKFEEMRKKEEELFEELKDFMDTAKKKPKQ